jgi:hypothetical protein
MKLRMIIETVQDQLTTLAGRHGISPEEVRSVCRRAGGKKCWKWVLNQWYDGKISFPEDREAVTTALSNFEEVFSRLPADKNDIMQYQSLKEVEEIVNPLVGIVSSKKKHKFEGLKGVKVVNENGPYVTVMVTDPESLGALGEGTKWCTRNSFHDCQKYDYIDRYGHIFIVFQNGRPVMQYTPDYGAIRDVDHKNVTDKELLFLIPPPELKEGNAKALYRYALKIMKGERWPEAEPYIMKDPEWAFWYAHNVMGRERWPEAEPYIMKDPRWASWYALNVMKGERWLEAEPYIMKSPEWAYYYADKIMKGERWPEAEPYIMKDPEQAFYYALMVINRNNKNYREMERWPEAEPYIMKDPELAYWYATDMMKKRWPEAEPYIMKDPRLVLSRGGGLATLARKYSDYFNLDWDV